MDSASNDIIRISVLKGIEQIIENFVVSLACKTPPQLTFRHNCWANVVFDQSSGLQMIPNARFTTISMHSKASIKKLSRMLKALCIIYLNVQERSRCTKRDIFYKDPSLFGRQSVLDKVIDDISLLLGVPRISFNVHSSGKGLVAGDLQYKEPFGNYIDCNRFPLGYSIPFFVEKITDIRSSAKFILIVEKDASFQRILENDFIGKCGPCIILTGKGFPDQNSRVLVKTLWDKLHLPTFCLVDADPHGIEIMTIYKYGSRALSHESRRLAVPNVQWLGVLPSDVDRLHIPRKVMLPMTYSDIKKGTDLLGKESICAHPDWIKEIEFMIATKMKAEIQCLDRISPTFLVDVYLPNKLKSFLHQKTDESQ